MAYSSEQFVEKEVVLTIRVPADFDREDERMLDDEFASILEKQGWELINSKEYRDLPGQNQIPVNRVTITRERYSEKEGWSDHFWVDASQVPSVELFKAAVRSYLQTPPGKEAIEACCQDFNWGDAMLYVPSEIWNEHGIYPFDFHRTPQELGLIPTGSDNLFSFMVDQDEVLIPEYDLDYKEGSLMIPAETLPQGWAWHHYPDGSGSLNSPDGKSYFIYDRSPYMNQRGIEYMETENTGWSVFWGNFDDFKRNAEKTASHNFIHTFTIPGEHGSGTDTAEPQPSLNEVVKAAENLSTKRAPALSRFIEPNREQ